MSASFLDALNSGRVLLMDGAMGTELQRQRGAGNECFEAWNLTRPEIVSGVHNAYVQAGADILLTNTFQANPASVARHGLDDRPHDIAEAAVGLARAACKPGGYVLLSIGPASGDISGMETLFGAAANAAGLLLETFSDLDLAAKLIAAYRAWPGDHVPVLLSFTFQKSPRGLQTFAGVSAAECAAAAERLRVAALGVNCGRDIGRDELLQILHDYRAVTPLPLMVRPNAGTPRLVDDQIRYPRSPQEMASWLPSLLDSGVRLVGGCCGTTPQHIAAFRAALDRLPAIRIW